MGLGGKKRKIPMQKIEKKDSRAITFSKRRKGLYGKASELCLLSGSSIAILATPVSSKPNAAFYSFGHSSVDSVVSAFLANQPPSEDLGLGFWWEDKSLLNSENPDELIDALESVSRLMNKVNGLRLDLKKKKKKKKDQTLNFGSSTSTSLCILEDLPADSDGFVKISGKEEEWILAISNKKKNDMDDDNLHLSGLDEDQILAISDKDNNNASPGDLDGCIQELDLYQFIDFETESEILSMNDVSMVTTDHNPFSSYGSAEDGGSLVMYRDLNDDHFHFSNLDEDQFQVLSDNNNETRFLSANLDGWNPDFDFETRNNESLLMKMDDASMMNTSQNPSSEWDEDKLHFSDVFNELDSITAL